MKYECWKAQNGNAGTRDSKLTSELKNIRSANRTRFSVMPARTNKTSTAFAFRISITLGLLAFTAVTTTFGQSLFRNIERAVGGTVKAGVQAATAPAQVVINTANVITSGAPPRSIYQPYLDVAKTTGTALTNTTSAVMATQAEIYQRVDSLAGSAGPEVAFIVDLGTYANRYTSELAASAAYATANGLRLENPLQILSTPLAGAIRAAHARHAPAARPLPDDVKTGLAGHFPPDILNRARFTVGKVEITLPTVIGRGQRFMDGNDFAVVVDDIIVFNVDPPNFSRAPGWWAHEVTHVAQYARWGIERFAYEYAKNGGSSIEGEADQAGSRATGQTLTDTVTASAIQVPAKPQPTSALATALPQVASNGTPVTWTTASDTSSSELPPPPPFVPIPERYIAACIFPNDPLPVDYLVTERGRIVAAERGTGRTMQIGWAEPATAEAAYYGAQWLYAVPAFRYAVSAQGHIFIKEATPFGVRPVQIGHVIRLQ